MTDESIEFENVRVGNWQIRLPSQICTDSNIFNHIFSLNTWNNVLTLEQRSRITQMLPQELLSNEGETAKTMKDLFSGTLSRFGTNPLGNFFNQLDAGHFDPGVVETKKEIKKVWRKDALRRRKKYHTKLLEEVVLSRETHLRKFTIEELHTQEQAQVHEENSYVIKAQQQNIIPVIVVPDNCNHETTSLVPGRSLEKHQLQQTFSENRVVSVKHVAKRIYDEVTSVNNTLRGLNFLDEGLPPSKKPTMASVAADNKIMKPNARTAKIVITKLDTPLSTSTTPVLAVAGKMTPPQISSLKSVTTQIPSSPAITPLRGVGALNSLSISSSIPIPNSTLETTTTVTQNPSVLPKTREEQAAAQMAKFPKILPAPSTSSMITNSNPKLSPTTTPHRNHQTKSVKLGSPLVKNSTNSNSNPSKSSPILASQLQAPVISSLNSNHAAFRRLVVPDTINKPMPLQQLQQSSIFPITDDMESSSDDEFEAIEPTIGFAPNLVFTKSSPHSRHGTGTYSRGNTTPSSRPLPGKLTTTSNSHVKSKINVNVAKTSNSMGTSTIKSNIPQQQKIITSPIVVTPSISKIPPIGNVSMISTLASTPTSTVPAPVPNAHSTPIPIATSSNFLTKQLLVQSGSIAPKLLPISIANVQNFAALNKVQKLQSYFSVSTTTTTTTVATTLNNGPSSNSTAIGTIIRSTKVMPSSIVNSVNVSTSSGSGISNVTHIPSSSSSVGAAIAASPLTLSLSDLNLNLNLGLSLDSNVDTKLMQDIDDKMDDLSVLDGNPFDSIPNLSDELDGFDLDLVDGLCDFDVLLSEEKQYVSFFSLIREVLCSTRDHRMTLVCLERTIRKWALSPIAALNLWFLRINDWNDALITALNFLAGNYQGSFHVHPEDFVPYIEYKYKTKYYQWIGAGRDSDNNLLPLCNMWLDNLDRLPPLKKHDGDNEDQEEDDDENEDSDGPGEEIKKKSKRPQTPPPPRCVTDWTVRPSTLEEKEVFQQQERIRFENPHKAFTYQMHSYESVVGPVKGVYSSQSGMTNKARGHSLLVDDRPPYVTILALVRDAVARLPNGEGTRSEICEMLRDSAFLAAEASNVTLNSVVSGALDRLHYERDPCVRYDSHKKSWIYLHRDRTQEQFERLHHNRSYTKSTKSRSNTSRKSRKQSKSSPPSQSTSQSSQTNCITNSVPSTSSAALISDTIIDPPPLQSTSTSLGNIITPATVSSATIAVQNTTTAAKPKLPPVASIVTKSTHIPVNTTPQHQKFDILNHTMNHDIKPVITDLPIQQSKQLKEILTSPPKQLPPSISSPLKDILSAAITAPTVPKLQYRSMSTTPISTSVLGKGWGQTTDILSSSNISTSGSTSHTQAPNQTVQLHVQNLGTSVLAPTSVALTTSASTPISSVNHIVGVTGANSSILQPNATLGPGQFLLGSNTLLRFASNVRFPEGVRFAQLRLPIQQNGPGSSQNLTPLRVPQRFVLTRGALPSLSGHTPTQGVLVGQTSTGQTIILSTTSGNLGSLPANTQAQMPSFTVSTQSQQKTIETRNIINHTSTSLSQANPTLSLTLSTPNSNLGGNTSNIVSSLTQNLNSSAQPVMNMATRVVTATISTPSPTISSGNLVASSAMGINTNTMNVNTLQVQSHQHQQQQLRVQQQVATTLASHGGLPLLAQVQSAVSAATQTQTQALTQAQSSASHPQLTSPIYIRSNQGDFVIPAHISLGRGMQGIKVIPVPAGKQTLLARLVTPGGSMAMAAPQVLPTPSPQSQASTEHL